MYASSRGTYTDTNALANVTIMGLSEKPASVSLNGHVLGSGLDFNQTSGCLKITGLNDVTSSGAWMNDWVLKWA